MQKSIFILAFIAFVACKKSKTEDPPIDRQQLPFSLDGGSWRIFINNNYGPDLFMFNTHDSLYAYRKVVSGRTVQEEGPFHTRAFNNPDSLELHLMNDTMILVKLDNKQVKITAGDSTRVFRKFTNPG